MSNRSTAPTFVLFARDLPRLSEFYRVILDLGVVEQGDTYQVLEGSAFELVIHQIPPEIAAGIRIEVPPELREDTPIKPVFTVPDLARLRTAALAAGGGLEDEAAAWTWRGHRILDGWDPEGNIIQFRTLV